MERGWPGRGPWMITATSTGVDWRVAATVLAAAAGVPVAVVVVGGRVAGEDPIRGHLAGVLELTAADQLSLEQARNMVVTMGWAHGLVLVGADAGLLVPVGRDGWTLADLAAAVNAPAVVVAGPGPDAVNHTTLALGALAGHGIVAAVVTIGEVDDQSLPVTPAGRIPAKLPDDLSGAAEWLDPTLRATPAPAPPAPAVVSPPAPGRAPVSGKRLVLGLLTVFAVMVLAVCGLAWSGRGSSDVEYHATLRPAPRLSLYVAPVTPQRTRIAVDACPQYAGKVAVTGPDAAGAARVNAAWQRIEKWLAGHAPAAARTLRPGAPAARIDAVQRQMSVTFPPDLVASLRRHDGVASLAGFSLPPFYVPETIDGILGDWKVTCSVLSGQDTAWGRENPWWDKAFVPFAQDGSGGCLFADQRAGGHGRIGEFYPEDGTSFERWPASFVELLEGTATSLETGRPYAGNYRPRVGTDGALDWEII
ncbi:SMI1/KNR4 family protein [Actinoplanes sp. NPDC051513]|uniref:SMI1/KNR4 family protein n=1 Tax=Actinoplanes sp. NPDC051513 TaxID=3363908 RepID=UPI00379E436C